MGADVYDFEYIPKPEYGSLVKVIIIYIFIFINNCFNKILNNKILFESYRFLMKKMKEVFWWNFSR